MVAVLLLFSLLSYNLLFRAAPKVEAATIGTSSTPVSTGGSSQRHVVATDTGKIVTFYQAGSQGVTGLVYSTSTDSGSTWSAPVQVDSTQFTDFDVAIYGNNNILIAFIDTNGLYERLLTYSGGSWTIGARTLIENRFLCVMDVSSGTVPSSPHLSIGTQGASLTYLLDDIFAQGCSETFYLNTLTTSGSSQRVVSVADYIDGYIADGKSRFILLSGYLYVDLNDDGNWVAVPGSPFMQAASVSYGLDELHILYQSVGIKYVKYSIANGIFSSPVTISSSTNDLTGGIATDSHNIWAVYQSYNAANSYDVQYKKFDGTNWTALSAVVTFDGLNNGGINVPERFPESNGVPIIWRVGTSSPYTIKSASIAGLGSVTDTGNHTGTLSGTLTGQSGDVIAKCGVWYYDTINIVTGMTLKICASNGQTGGYLEIHANTVTIAGTVDGGGRGLPGGVNIMASGGSAGSYGQVGAQSPTAGGNGGTATAGASGSGDFAGTGGSAGTSGSGGAVGVNSGSLPPAGGGGGGGLGASASGGNGNNGGYATAGANGDLTTDESLAIASGGGAGGSGGAGGGGGGGSTGGSCTSGAGGAGANGGIGGKGGNAGATFKVYASGNITNTGQIKLNGQAASTAGPATSGSDGTAGGAGTSIECTGI